MIDWVGGLLDWLKRGRGPFVSVGSLEKRREKEKKG
jgi:hypothetical protein